MEPLNGYLALELAAAYAEIEGLRKKCVDTERVNKRLKLHMAEGRTINEMLMSERVLNARKTELARDYAAWLEEHAFTEGGRKLPKWAWRIQWGDSEFMGVLETRSMVDFIEATYESMVSWEEGEEESETDNMEE